MLMNAGPRIRFITYAAIFSVATVALWYWLLLNPMSGALRLSEQFVLRLLPGSGPDTRVAVGANGMWTASVPLASGLAPAWVAAYVPKGRGSPTISAVNVTMAKSTLSLFTLGLPLYWAIILAAPPIGRSWRPLAIGTLLLAAAAPVSCFVFGAHLAGPYLWGPGSATAKTADAVAYLAAYVAPDFAPLVLAVALHKGLRSLVFPWAAEWSITEARQAPRARVRESRRKG